jgi:hypothetical protein
MIDRQSCAPVSPPTARGRESKGGATSGGGDIQPAVSLGERRGVVTDAAIARTAGLLVGGREGVHEPGGRGGGHVRGRVGVVVGVVEVNGRAHVCCVYCACGWGLCGGGRGLWAGL